MFRPLRSLVLSAAAFAAWSLLISPAAAQIQQQDVAQSADAFAPSDLRTYLADNFPADLAVAEVVSTVWETVLEMSGPELVLNSRIEQLFHVNLHELLLRQMGNPQELVSRLSVGVVTDLTEDLIVQRAADYVADAILEEVSPGIGPERQLLLHTVISSTVEEAWSIYRGLQQGGTTGAVASGLIDVGLDAYRIAIAVGETLDARDAALVALVENVALAARLITIAPGERAARTAQSALATARDVLPAIVGHDDALVVDDIMTTAFVGLVALGRGDTVRARQMAERTLRTGLGDSDLDVGGFEIGDVLEWIEALRTGRFENAAERAANAFVFGTELRTLFAPPAADSGSHDAAHRGSWGPGIVVIGDPDYERCRSHGVPECLAAHRASIEAVAFARAFGEGWATSFRELGNVDLVEVLSPFRANSNDFSVLVAPDGTIHQLPFPEELTARFDRRRLDRASQRVFSRWPNFAVHSIRVVGHRVLFDGRQRFVLAALIMDGCRACDMIAESYQYLDFSFSGEELDHRFIGATEGTMENPTNPDRTSHLLRDTVAVQSALNSRGYLAGPMDGIMGQGSRSALSEFQTDYCLPATGTIDVETARQLATADRFSMPPCAMVEMEDDRWPFEAGRYALEPGLCSTDPDDRARFGDAAMIGIVYLDEHEYSQGEAVCTIRSIGFQGETVSISAECSLEGGRPSTAWFQFHRISRTAFTMAGRNGVFSLCEDAEQRSSASLFPFPDGFYVDDPYWCHVDADYVALALESGAVSGVAFADNTIYEHHWCRAISTRRDGDSYEFSTLCAPPALGTPESTYQQSTTIRLLPADRIQFESSLGRSEVLTRCPPETRRREIGTGRHYLVPGEYRTDRSQCGSADWSEGGRRDIIMPRVAFSPEEACEISSISANGTEANFQGDCSSEAGEGVLAWTWRIEGDVEFSEIRGPHDRASGPERRYTRCSSDEVRVNDRTAGGRGRVYQFIRQFDPALCGNRCSNRIDGAFFRAETVDRLRASELQIDNACAFVSDFSSMQCFPVRGNPFAAPGFDPNDFHVYWIEDTHCTDTACLRGIIAYDRAYADLATDGTTVELRGFYADLVLPESGIPPDHALAAPAAMTASAESIARELLDAYNGDRERMRLIADNADYALLSWAVYGDEQAQLAAAQAGWSESDPYVIRNEITGDTVAMLYTHSDGRTVLAFRGSTEPGDWVTNIGATMTDLPILADQLRGASAIAQAVIIDHPDVVFVGHSLAGRLAQIARLVTRRPAIVFDSAPLGQFEISDPLVRQGLESLLANESSAGPLLRFRGASDALTAAFPRDDTVVSNVVDPERTSGLARLNVIRTAIFGIVGQVRVAHSIALLAQAMAVVQIAEELGWLDTVP